MTGSPAILSGHHDRELRGLGTRTRPWSALRMTGALRLGAAVALLLRVVGNREGPEAVAHVAHRLDERVVAVLDLAPQAPDVDVHCAGAAVEIVAPHLVQKRLAVQDTVRVRGQE